MQMESFIIIDDVEIFWLCFDMILVENQGRLGNHFLKTGLFGNRVAFIISLTRLMTTDPGC